MARFTITLSVEALENLKRYQKVLENKFGGGRVTQGFAIGYSIKQSLETEEANNKNKDMESHP